MSPEKVLITGAAGFIGRYLLDGLLDAGSKVTCLMRNTGGLPDRKGLTKIEGDLGKDRPLSGLDCPFDTVYHLAALGNVASISEEAYRDFSRINVEGTAKLIESLDRSKIGRFIHFSSTAAVGLIEDAPVDETFEPRPATPYQRSKLESEEKVLEYYRNENFPAVIIRPCMVYGPGGKGEFLKIVRLISRGIFPRVGLGKALTPMVHVRDVVQAALKAGDRGKAGKVYFIAGEKSCPMAEIHRLVCKALGRNKPYLYVPRWAGWLAGFILERQARIMGKPPVATRLNIASTAANRIFDISRAVNDLGYAPSVKPEEGIPETVRWFRAEGLV